MYLSHENKIAMFSFSLHPLPLTHANFCQSFGQYLIFEIFVNI